ncbi:hypothetical protein QYM36_001340 [Artemia franciscana]|nr:hypothetical protein QYM36_001340 [Artemia franciscana]
MAVQSAMQCIATGPGSGKYTPAQEFAIMERIKLHFCEKRRQTDGVRFIELCDKLKGSRVLRNRVSVVVLLYCLRDSTLNSTGTQPGFLLPQHLETIEDNLSTTAIVDKPLRGNVTTSHPPRQLRAYDNGIDANPGSHKKLLREIIFALQGIGGEIIRMSADKDGFRVDESVKMPSPIRKRSLSIIEMGFMYMRISKFCEDKLRDSSVGMVGQAFVSAIQAELLEFYRLLALFESQVTSKSNISPADTPMEDIPVPNITLHRLFLWTLEPRKRLANMVSLVDACRNSKGGELISCIFPYTFQGDQGIYSSVVNVLGRTAKPLLIMITEWILSGSLDDPYNEFFISVDQKVPDQELWDSKYSIRQTMVPSFLSREDAQMILTAGKSLRFLREVCGDSSEIPGHAKLIKIIREGGEEPWIVKWEDGELRELVVESCDATSKHLLMVMMNKYELAKHFDAFRKYIMLSQGDFAFTLLEALTPELNKPILSVSSHVLATLLETAIRQTNAQFDDSEVLKRLDVTLDNTGQTGWDGFSLEYRIDGPLLTITSVEMKAEYTNIFRFLWKTKYVENLLVKLWRSQTVSGRLLNKLPEARGLAHSAHLLLFQMIHFVRQMAYYITFEVLACTWETLSRKLKSARSMDDVIVAHKEFLETTAMRTLVNLDSPMHLRHTLQSLYSIIILFGELQEKMFRGFEDECRKRKEFEERMVAHIVESSGSQVARERSRREEFSSNFVMKMKAKFRVLAKSYEDKVQDFLLSLSSQADPSLQQLSFRLDFNDFYHRKNDRLSMSVTFQARRQVGSKLP